MCLHAFYQQFSFNDNYYINPLQGFIDNSGIKQQLSIVESGVLYSAKLYNDIKDKNDVLAKTLKKKLANLDEQRRNFEGLNAMKQVRTVRKIVELLRCFELSIHYWHVPLMSIYSWNSCTFLLTGWYGWFSTNRWIAKRSFEHRIRNIETFSLFIAIGPHGHALTKQWFKIRHTYGHYGSYHACCH